MAQTYPTPRFAQAEDAVITLFCLTDDAYRSINPRNRHHESLKQLSDSEVLALALLQQLRGVESERSRKPHGPGVRDLSSRRSFPTRRRSDSGSGEDAPEACPGATGAAGR